MKYIDLSKLPVSPSSEITNIVALNEDGDIIKAQFEDYATTAQVEENETVVAAALNELNKNIGDVQTSLEEEIENVNSNIPTPQNLGTTVNADDKKYIYRGNGDIDVVSGLYPQYWNGVVDLKIKKWGTSSVGTQTIKAATQNTAGVMSATDKINLDNSTVNKVIWSDSSNINTFTTSGVYDITGERTNANDNLPIMNSNPGHTIAARLYVLDSSISGNGASDDKCLTQVLMLSNRVGGDGNLYIRTGRGSSISNISWEQWGTLQQNINVGTITSYDNLIDNGIYSGVYTNGSTKFDTFVMVVINNYAVAGQVGAERTISQFLYVTHIDGSVEFLRRASLVNQYNGNLSWYKWKGLFNDSQYIYNLPTAPDMQNITKQVLWYEHTDFTVPSGSLNKKFYDYIKNLISANNYLVEVFAEATEYNSYKSTNGIVERIFADIYCYDTNFNFKKYIKIWVNDSKGLKVIQEIDIT